MRSTISKFMTVLRDTVSHPTLYGKPKWPDKLTERKALSEGARKLHLARLAKEAAVG